MQDAHPAAAPYRDLVPVPQVGDVDPAVVLTVPVENSRELHAAIAGSEYAEIDSGHVVLMERPEEWVRLVAEFVLRPR
ncbi:alpha/beta fold hydrolase [Microtetraspora sp. AC03309]|uniref:alpha/beta fold hydrolase n=1 Tax=Microtetraspora sp. AC03309 TaxID=2779376 RepID=UPI001E290437|nr:hypothetical protein [Microtetraspora sp. AC03309]